MPGSAILPAYWWIFVLRGVAAVAFGVFAVAWPAPTAKMLLSFFAVCALLDGLASFAIARRMRAWAWPVFAGIAGIAIASIAAFAPRVAILALVLLIGAHAVFRGLFDMAAAIAMRRLVTYEWWLGASGLAAVGSGLFLLVRPARDALALAPSIGAFALLIGVLLIAGGAHLRSLAERESESGTLSPSGRS